MASGIARGCVRTKESRKMSRKMAAIFELIGWPRQATLVYNVHL